MIETSRTSQEQSLAYFLILLKQAVYQSNYFHINPAMIVTINHNVAEQHCCISQTLFVSEHVIVRTYCKISHLQEGTQP